MLQKAPSMAQIGVVASIIRFRHMTGNPKSQRGMMCLKGENFVNRREAKREGKKIVNQGAFVGGDGQSQGEPWGEGKKIKVVN